MLSCNRWHHAILNELVAASLSSIPDRQSKTNAEIWDGMRAAGFEHRSAEPRSTLSARILELYKAGKIERVKTLKRERGRAVYSYRLARSQAQ